MKELVRIFKALSDKNRVRILKMLEIKPLCVCEITEVLKLAPSTTSKHLSILRDANLIFDQKEKKWVNYHLNRATQQKYIKELIPLLKKWIQDDNLIERDREKVKCVNREELIK
jgi:ArsR family transcriptional regulator